MEDKFVVRLPSNIYGGIGTIENIKDILITEKVKKIAIITDKGIKQSSTYSKIILLLKNVEKIIIDDTPQEPTYLEVVKIIKKLEEEHIDFIIGVGGGSVMDTAKLCSILYKAPYTIKELLECPELGEKKVKTLMIPTTCGTGSEATCNAIVAVPEEGLKVGIVNQNLIPDYVVLDPVTLESLPKKLIASTGIDALCHCLECLTSNKSNMFSQLYALNGGALILKNIEKAFLDSKDLKAKYNMLIGSFYGGMAITASGTTAIHALSYPLGGKFHIPHGISNAIMMVPVMEFNRSACQKELALLYDQIWPENYSYSVEEKSEKIIKELKDLVSLMNIPSLKDYGLSEDDLDFLVEAGSKVTRLLNNNLKKITKEDMRKIYMSVI